MSLGRGRGPGDSVGLVKPYPRVREDGREGIEVLIDLRRRDKNVEPFSPVSLKFGLNMSKVTEWPVCTIQDV